MTSPSIANGHVVGSLKVTKIFGENSEIDGSNLSADEKAGITFTVKNASDQVIDGGSFTYADIEATSYKQFNNLPVGTYTVTETIATGKEVANYTMSTTYSVEGGAQAVAESNTESNPAEVTVTNTYTQDTGNLILKKTVVAPGEMTIPQSYTFNVQGEDGLYYGPGEGADDATVSSDKPIAITVKSNDANGVKINNLQIQKYTVTEVTGDNNANIAVKGYNVSVNGSGQIVTLTKDATETVEITNTYGKAPTFQKKIKDINDSTDTAYSEWIDSADHDIGDEVPYQLKAKLASNVTDYKEYHVTFHDEMEEGLTFKEITKVTVGDTELEKAGYSLNVAEDKHSFTLYIPFGDPGHSPQYNSAEVIVEFTAVLNEKAVLGSKGNVNKAYLEYSCNPKWEATGTAGEKPDTDKTEEDFVICFTYEVDVNKVDPEGKALAGAEFTLEKKLKDGTKKLIDCVTASEGTAFKFTGLDDGIYILTETKVPEGFTGIQPVTFEVKAEHDTLWTDLEKRNDVLTKLTGDVLTGELTFTVDKGTGSLTADVPNTKNGIKVQKVDVNDQHELEGAVIQILDEEGKVVVEFTSKLEATEIEDLEVGKTYTLHEEVAPNGYLTRSDTTFTIDKDGKVTGSATIDKDEEGNIVLLVEDQMKKLSATVRKVWDDEEDRDGLRPKSITVSLLQNGEVYKSVPLNASNNWTAMVKDLPTVDSACKDYTYTWAEPAAIEGYTLTGNKTTGTLTTLTNTHVTEETEVKVRKVWADSDNAARKRPASITVQLYADGQVCGTPITLDASNNWSGRWQNLKKNDQGAEIKYTVAETEIPEGYVAKITGNATSGFVITNTTGTGKLVIEKQFDIKVPEEEPEEEEQLTEIEVVKIWEDNDDKDGNRPASITVHLFAGGEEIRTATLSAATGWKKTFGDLPKFVNGHPINYSVTEDPVEWYVTEINGFTIRNKYTPQTTSLTVKKVWNDENNKLNIRPNSVAMKLNNGTVVMLNEENGWTATVTNLPTRIHGQPAVYYWTEQEVVGYVLESTVAEGNVAIFTNKPWERPDQPKEGGKPRTTGDTWFVFEEYDTPLGVEVVINHVGDCFD